MKLVILTNKEVDMLNKMTTDSLYEIEKKSRESEDTASVNVDKAIIINILKKI